VQRVAATVMANAGDGRPAYDAVDLQPGTTLIAPHGRVRQGPEHPIDPADGQLAAGEKELEARDVPAAHPALDRAATEAVTSEGAERSPRLAPRHAVDDEAFASLEAAHGGPRLGSEDAVDGTPVDAVLTKRDLECGDVRGTRARS
jgi:hypothetical protein